jgi:serine/threonine protein kinase
MKSLVASVRDDGGFDRAAGAMRALEAEWKLGRARMEEHWSRQGAAGSISLLASLIKADLRCRYARGEAAAVAEYLERFPALREEGDRVLSLIYEEFCLREERGERPDPKRFCDLYPAWRDSIASQLRYHRMLSGVAGAQPPPPQFPEPGERFGGFQLIAQLGQGGAGRVFLARDESIGGREVVLKVSADRGQEAAILGQLQHSHIIDIRSVVDDPGTGLRGLCMPYRPGLPLNEVIEVIRRDYASSRPRTAQALWKVVAASAAKVQSRALPDFPGWVGFPLGGSFADAVAWIIATLARALAHAHEREIFHRDVKPANVLLTRRDGPQLLDFNLAHDPHSVGQAEAARRGGTLPYMAPEQLKAFLDPADWGRVGAAADLFSLGLVTCELLSGRPAETPDATLPLPRATRGLLDFRADFRVSIRRHDPGVPCALEAIVARCLAYSPDERYPDALALADDLERFLERRPLRHAFNPSVLERIGNRARRHPWRLLAAAIVFATMIPVVSRMAIVWLVPVERREAFRSAVADLEAGRDRSIERLEALSQDYPDSPLVPFYLSVALARKNDIEGAAREFNRALNQTHAVEDLVAWGRDHPDVAAHAEALGDALCNPYPTLALLAFPIALKLDPKLIAASQGAAKLLRLERKYKEAHELLTSLIREVEPRHSPKDRRYLFNCYWLRALVDIERAEMSPRGPRSARDDLSGIQMIFREALEDLERGKTFLESSDPMRESAYKLATIRAKIGLGDLLTLEGDRAEAERFYNDARKALATLIPVDDEQDKEREKLRQNLPSSPGPGADSPPPQAD